MTPTPASPAREVSPEQLDEAGRRLWHSVPRGGVVWITGDLGAGKTSLVQAITREAGADQARSPTFALIHQYQSPEGLVIHVDCYRLRDQAEALDLDLSQLARDARLTLIEWPERAGPHAPAPDVRVHLAHTGRPDRRRLEIAP